MSNLPVMTKEECIYYSSRIPTLTWNEMLKLYSVIIGRIPVSLARAKKTPENVQMLQNELYNRLQRGIKERGIRRRYDQEFMYITLFKPLNLRIGDKHYIGEPGDLIAIPYEFYKDYLDANSHIPACERAFLCYRTYVGKLKGKPNDPLKHHYSSKTES